MLGEHKSRGMAGAGAGQVSIRAISSTVYLVQHEDIGNVNDETAASHVSKPGRAVVRLLWVEKGVMEFWDWVSDWVKD